MKAFLGDLKEIYFAKFDQHSPSRFFSSNTLKRFLHFYGHLTFDQKTKYGKMFKIKIEL